MNNKNFRNQDLNTCIFSTIFLVFFLSIIPGISTASEAVLRREQSHEEQQAKENNAKGIMGAIIRAQQAFAFENKELATDISQLDVSFAPKFYTYKIEPQTLKEVSIISASPVERDLPAFSSAIWYNFQEFEYSQIICESPDSKARLDIKFIGDLTKPKGICPDKTKRIISLGELH